MKILVVSDIHENSANLSRVLAKIPELGVEKVFCLGDLINGGIGKRLVSQKIPAHIIWGNNDGNRTSIIKACFESNNGSIVSDNEFDTCEIDGRRIFLTHYPVIAQSIAKSGDYDAVMYGHDHLKHQEVIGNCLLLNPGEICAKRTGECTYAVYDSVTNTTEIFELENPVSLSHKA